LAPCMAYGHMLLLPVLWRFLQLLPLLAVLRRLLWHLLQL
jgi:hypothetical protein